MNRLAQFIVERSRLAWAIAAVAIMAVTLGAFYLARDMREDERISLLQTEAGRLGVELMSQTLDGTLMGSVAMLGLLDGQIKRDARGEGKVNAPEMLGTLESVTRAYAAQGVFVVGTNGVIRSSWDSSNKPSTGLDVRFRPYFKMAMQGKENIYAAVSLARGDRALYYASPVYATPTRSDKVIGAVVARTDLAKIDAMLHNKSDIALLLSPQGVVFASSRPQWVGFLAGEPTPERLQAIRELKQFGNMFEKQTPSVLPLAVADGRAVLEGRRFAVASAGVVWNDPFGDWKLVLLEDLARTVPFGFKFVVADAAAVLGFVLAAVLFHLLRSHHEQRLAAGQVEAYARVQQRAVERKSQQAATTLRLQQAGSVGELAQVFLSELHQSLEVLQGVIYVANDQPGGALQLAGSYACSDAVPATLVPGEGMLGQCAVERVMRMVATPSEGMWAIRSGLGSTRPAALIMAPIMLHDTLLGVLEIAMLSVPDEETQQQFEDLVDLLAMNLEIVRRSQRTEELLSNSAAAERAKAEQLAFQQALVDTIPYPVFYKGTDTRFLGVNRAYEATFNVQREALIGKRVLDLDYLPEADRLAYQAEDEATIASAGTVRRDMQIPFADGRLHDTLYYVSGFRRQDGSPGGLVGTFIDISATRNAERELERLADAERFNQLAQGREQRILELKQEINALAEAAGQPAPYAAALVETVGDHVVVPHPDYRTDLGDEVQVLQLAELVNLEELQALLTNFCESVGIAAAIIDLQGKILAAARWQPVCTDFHRANPESCALCIESDTKLALQLNEGQDFTLYKCKNGMTDAAAPIIVEGHHLANVFIGQFHSEPPDLAFFRAQARKFGYDEAAYLDAVAAAPVIDEKRLPAILSFLSGFAHMISTMSLARQRADAAQARLQQQAALLQQERVAALSLAEDAEQARRTLERLSRESQA